MYVCVLCWCRHTTGRIKHIWLQKLTLVLDFIWIAWHGIQCALWMCVWVLVRSTAVPISHSFEYLIHKPTIPAQLLKTSKTFGIVFSLCLFSFLLFLPILWFVFRMNWFSMWTKHRMKYEKYDMYQSFCTIKMQDETKNRPKIKTFKFGWKKVGFFSFLRKNVQNTHTKKS